MSGTAVLADDRRTALSSNEDDDDGDKIETIIFRIQFFRTRAFEDGDSQSLGPLPHKVTTATQTYTTSPPRALRCRPTTTKSRIVPSASTSIPTPTQQQQQQGHWGPSKLPKFLQKASRDRARSMTDPLAAVTATGSSASIADSSSSGSGRKGGSRLGGVVKKAAQAQASDSMDEPPVIIEPVPAPTASNPNPRPRTRSERPISDIGHYSPPTPSTSRIGDLPTQLSGWFSHTFSSTDLSLPSLLSQSSQLSSASSSSSSPKQKAAPSPPRPVTGPITSIEPYAIYSIAMPSLIGVLIRFGYWELDILDRCIYQSEVFAATTSTPTVDRKAGATKGKGEERERGDMRCWCSLGLDWTLYTFPQSVGIASGRPSSYYFVGSQADSLFYLDPHHARPAVPLKPPPPPPLETIARLRGERQTTPELSGNNGREDEADEPFFDTRDGTWSSSISPDASVRGRARSSDFDTEEGPGTPGRTQGLREDADVGDQDDDDDDDGVDPSVPTSPPKNQAPAMVQNPLEQFQQSTNLPLSSMEDTTTPQQEDFQQQRDQLLEMQQQENGKQLQRMHTARARDGGRTQSSVKGVLTAEDGGEIF
ncbi:hypothetical protein PILCRDRAFT_11030 [Piloderma croceum F 1598]|uniref:Cysteine protease n=1 Tax=Piloderma croceum (strain F 1598) TaxID=765440 RepID=A0A0C3BMN3_PILCF|nr:hypothetical protein PILCRDRAFT_11030 [Piloderma croceum F 1598]